MHVFACLTSIIELRAKQGGLVVVGKSTMTQISWFDLIQTLERTDIL